MLARRMRFWCQWTFRALACWLRPAVESRENSHESSMTPSVGMWNQTTACAGDFQGWLLSRRDSGLLNPVCRDCLSEQEMARHKVVAWAVVQSAG